ncbi:MAG: hypothetical protein E7515_00410 [Ruminococcaceae bacterium]|jgi:hypothetical protein|nr:hypothetical protein [Oscillospiraceae bacterium]
MNKTEIISIERIPENVEQLKEMSACSLTTPFQTAALAVAVLCNYEKDVEKTIEMINYLKGPAELSNLEKQFLRDRLVEKAYVSRSYFKGTSPQNDYALPDTLEIEVSDNPYSYDNEGYAVLYLKSSGADSPRQVKLRRKGDNWYLWEILFLSDIRVPASLDPWA